MTVVRRELPPSKGASHPSARTRRRIVSARVLQSCPHRARRDAAQEAHVHEGGEPTPPGDVASCGPDEADEFAGEGRYRDGGPFAVPDEMAIATMQA
jgi:hypothetical protein